ncbi:MAG: FG-GAP-like repeat-containing protein [Pyrinomonadaceae bacterium]
MNYKLLKNCLWTITILCCSTAITTFSQNEGPAVTAPETAGSFSTFSAPQNMGAVLNAPEMEQSPAPAPNGLSLYFTSNRPGGQGGNDIYVSQRTTLSSAWGAPQNLGTTLNTSSNDTVSNISPDGREMFLTSNRAGGSGGSDLYVSTRTNVNDDFGWTAPVNLGPVVNSTLLDVGGVYFTDSATGAGTFFFWSDRAETGLGDIYQSTRNADGTFNTPQPVGELNSPASERGIAISRSGLEMYISSNRFGPAAVFAIFVSTRASTSASWNLPIFVAGLNEGSTSSPALSADGTIIYLASNRTGTFGMGDLYSSTRVSVNRSAPADFDGDGRTDISVFRPSEGNWYIMRSGGGIDIVPWGLPGDNPVPGDYDGDGRADTAIFRPSEGNWYVINSSNFSLSIQQWGLPGNIDIPVSGDFDGDGKFDRSVFRQGVWHILRSTGGIDVVNWGLVGDIPVLSDRSQ